MPFKFNPFSGNFDQTGSGGGGGGSAFFAGEVATYADLPLDGTAALNSRWLVRSNSGTWPFSSYKQAGIYIRTATGGTDRDADYQFVGTLPSVMNDNEFLIYDDADATKNLKFSLSGITSATTRTLTVPDASGTIALGLEYIGQAIDSAGNINVLANKHYTFTKNVNDNISIRLPTTANDGDRIVIRRSGNNTQGVLTIDRLGGMPSVQTIGVLTAPNTVFFAVWSGLWRQDFIPPAGFQGAPASVSAFGSAGQMAYQDPHLYICVDSNTWRRLTLTTF